MTPAPFPSDVAERTPEQLAYADDVIKRVFGVPYEKPIGDRQ